jgi:NADPH-dependent 2,4-dienoyl-CoA reductase/sulfur reductase-like enzyme
MRRLLIIGGSDAGISAAIRARELDRSADISVVLADAFPNYSICGLPFYISGETPDWHSLAHRTEFDGITFFKDHTALAIDTAERCVEVRSRLGVARKLPYDKLLIATGATPLKPEIKGLDLPGVYPLHTMQQGLEVRERVSRGDVRTIAIVGSGYIGVEMADALKHRGLHVTLIGRSPSPFPSVDASLGTLVEDELSRNGVAVANGIEVQEIIRDGAWLTIRGSRGFCKTVDVVVYAVGVGPRAELARNAGIPVGLRGAICVDRMMRTSAPDIYAAGDCAETWHGLLERYTYFPLGTTAHKQGRIAGENMVEGNREFLGSVGTQVVKMFDLAIARTGLSDDEAAQAGFDPSTTDITVSSHKAYYPGAKNLRIRVTGDRISGRLLGAQIAGHHTAQIAKRIDIFAGALFNGMTVEALNDLDLSYTPPFSSPWDPVQMAAQAWSQSGKSIKQEQQI